MSKPTTADERQQRLAAKLKENLKRRKAQMRARAQAGTTGPEEKPAPSEGRKPAGK